MNNDQTASFFSLSDLSFSGVKLKEIAESVETPCYLYALSGIEARCLDIRDGLGPDFRLYYAIKANPNPEIIRRLVPWCHGLDISSGGELRQAMMAGWPTAAMSFAGPGKSDWELRLAIQNDIGSISVESVNELKRIQGLASELNRIANVSVRINPLRSFQAFAVKMGGRPCQFGIDEEQIESFFATLAWCDRCRFRGIHVYSGTQCLQVDTLVDNVRNTLEIAGILAQRFVVTPEYINFGGGFGVAYHANQVPLDARKVCVQFRELFADFKVRHGLDKVVGIIELGRYLIAESGVYIAQIVDVKISRGMKFCVLNGGMNHHLAASGQFGQVIRKNFRMVNISALSDALPEKVTVVGPLCTSLDLMGDQVTLLEPHVGHYVAILDAGAYGYTASPLWFLSHQTPVELLLERNGEIKIIRDGKTKNQDLGGR